MSEAAYKDPEWLHREYVEERRSQSDIADEFDVTPASIRYQLRKHDIERPPDPWDDPDVLYRLYHEEGLDSVELGDRWDVDSTTVTKAMERHGIDRRSKSMATRQTHATYTRTADDYSKWSDAVNGEYEYVYVHRLLAVVEHGFDAVAQADHIHHGADGVEHPLANWAENVEPIGHKEHLRHHLAKD